MNECMLLHGRLHQINFQYQDPYVWAGTTAWSGMALGMTGIEVRGEGDNVTQLVGPTFMDCLNTLASRWHPDNVGFGETRRTI